jgi:hypothetical protein
VTSSEPASGPPAFTDSRALSPLAYAGLVGSVFSCSWLLFSIEPMAAKLLLPRLGGTPTVWITCLLFFQAALLVGYAYSHISLRLLGLRRQAVVHMGLVVTSLAFLPPSFEGLEPPRDGSPILWLLGVLTTTIGLPFVVLSSFGPIAQKWLTQTDATRGDPYFLYAASNAGSLLALLAYPLVVEPLLALDRQTSVWSASYAALAALLIIIAIVMRRVSAARAMCTDHAIEQSAVTRTDRFRWVIYAAVPSSMLMGATSFISTDIASFPLLWVVPLALYLLSYAMAFARTPPLKHSLMVRSEAHAIVLVALTMYWAVALPGLFDTVLHLAMLFLVAMVCHGELAKARPAARHLTEFYLWLAIGGLVGGVFNALLAPVVFSEVLEYPIAIVAAAFIRPRKPAGYPNLDVVAPILFAAALVAASWRPGSPPQLVPTLAMIGFGTLLFMFRDRPLRFALALAFMLTIGVVRLTSLPSGRQLVAVDRSFFGVYRVLDNQSTQIRTMESGTTMHGAQSRIPSMRLEPLSYYHRRGPAGDIFGMTTPGRLSTRRVGMVGLGAGSLACYGNSNEKWTFFEIDPLVAKLAGDTSFFTFLRDCPPRLRIVLGDARLTLAHVEDSGFDLLVLDAFTSGAIPVHLMTREAIGDYFRILDKNGVLAIHISNDHLDLQPLVAAIAEDLGLVARVRYDVYSGGGTDLITHSASVWAVVARNESAFGSLSTDASWRLASNTGGVRPWTDDFSNILSVIRWR